MPDFELSGPDGAKYQISAPDENSALSAFQQFSGGVSRETAPAAPISANDVVRATATGVPIAGGVLNKLNAATNAALAPAIEPLMEKSADSINDAPGATALERFVNRYKKSLAIQDAQDAKFAKEHPIVDTVAKVAGGVGATIPLVMAAPAMMGASGTLPQMVTRGAASGAGISAADAAVRGEDVVTGAGVGGALGAGAPLVARGVGAIARAVRPAPAPVPMRTVKVGGVEVPVSESQVTGDAAQSAEEQLFARGAHGDKAQGVHQDWEGLQNQRLGAATDEIAAGLDPAGVSARTAPQAAGERVIEELAQADATRIATDNARRARVGAQGQDLRAAAGAPDLPEGLRFSAQPSRDIRPNADPRAHEIQIVGADGKPHYRMEITQEGDGLFGVGYVENLSREHSGLGARLYQEAAKYAESQGGRLIAGMNTNAQSTPVLNRLAQSGAATPVEIGGRQLFQIHPAGAVDSAFRGAEVTGAGVARARDAHVARTKGLYDEVRDAPGAFDPAVPKGLAEDIRGRLNTGPDPIWVDPDTTSKANEAFKLIDQTVGEGMFKNAAARRAGPVGPVAEAAAGGAPKAPATEAEAALAELVAKGINPAKARAAVANLPGGRELQAGRESIGQVAVRDNETGKVTSGLNVHSDLREDAAAKAGITDENLIFSDQRFTDGFMTKSGRFVTREEAAKIASEADQVKTYPLYEDNAGPYLQHSDLKPETLGTGTVSHFEPHAVALPNGGSVQVKPKVVEAASIKTSADEGYDAALQPRDRSRAASSAQVNDMARNLNPNRLGVSSEADRGAPIVGADGMVESGNGRVLAVRQAYAEGGESAAKYRAWLESQGVDVSKFREPVLVRERVTPMNAAERKAFTVSANQSSTLSLSAPERALADSRALTPESLTLIRNPADLGAVENREFVRAFMNGVPQAERGALMTASGDLSSEGLARVRNAVLAKAYGDTPILSRIAESTSDDIKSISNALVSSAPEWASLKGAIASGQVPAEMDVTKDLLDAVNRTARIRGKGVSLESSQAQADAFSAQSEESKLFQRMFYDADGAKAAPAAQVSSALRNYAQEAAKVDAAPGLGLGLPPVTARDILEVTAKKMGAPAELAKEVIERAAAIATPAAAGEPITEVGLREMDAARKRLVVMYGDAKRAAMGPGGSGSDMRAMGRILHEFDNSIIDAFDAGRFSGDGEAAKALLRDARASHALYRETFTNRGGTDPVGRSIEKILGRYADTAATPDEIARLSYGSLGEPGGGDAMKVAQRLKQILGPTSPEWGAYKQGLVSHLIDAPEGTTRGAAATADRIDKFLTGTKGRGLAQIALSAEERAGLKSYADNLRMTEPVAATTPIDKTIARIAGRDGGVPMSGDEVVDLLVSKNVSGNKGFSAALAERLKRDLSPEGWTSVRQGLWSKVTEPLAGKPELQAQALHSRITGFLDSDLAKSAYSATERAKMEALAKVYKQIIPVKGTTNPSGTAPMLAKVARGMSNNLLTMLGAVHSGFIGAGVGYGLQKGLAGVAERRGAKAAVESFYGSQPRAAIKSSRVPIILSQGATPAQQQ